MSAIRQRIQEKIAQAMPREMFGQLHMGCENQPAPVNASFLRFTAQIARGLRIVLQQPEHAAVNVFEESYPDLENLRRDLAGVVEAAKHQALSGQPCLRAAG